MTNVKPLMPGDIIGIAASASPFEKTEFKKGVKVLEDMGFNVHFRKDIFDQSRYLAGTDKRRAEELMEMFCASKVKAILFARGGYGSQRIIPLLDWQIINKHRKPVIGFSDLTALLTFLRQKCDVPTFYGPVVTLLGKRPDNITRETLYTALTSKAPIGQAPSGKAAVLRPGTVEGRFVGGCLSLINSSIGTAYDLDTTDSIFFIEDVGEKVYVLDRMLTQLKNAGKFGKARGVIFGAIVLKEGEEYDVKTMIMDVLSDFEGPIIMDYPAGHANGFVTLPLGVNASLNALDSGRMNLEFKASLFNQ